jgi:hypothetical protein
MATPKMQRTNTPGIYRRHAKSCDRTGRCECSYVIVWRHRGRQHTETYRTLAEAREGKRSREVDVDRGEFSPAIRAALREYALEWPATAPLTEAREASSCWARLSG